MSHFDVHILGCGSALPTGVHLPTSQVIDIHGKLYMIDCGEGAQRQFRLQKLSFSRLTCIFISHLHGDHCFGLFGLLSSLSMLGRTGELYLIGPHGLRQLLSSFCSLYGEHLGYKLIIQEEDDRVPHTVWEDRSVCVRSLPLEHRMPTMGYLVEEKKQTLGIDKPSTEFFGIPKSYHTKLLQGEDFVTEEGKVIPNSRLTKFLGHPRRYAYCSDTSYSPALVPLIAGVDLLYHEATFTSELSARAMTTGHSTAHQAATVAREAQVGKLLIGHYSARYTSPDPLLAEAQVIFPQTLAATEGLRIRL